jgi:hypothetical protein
MELIGIEKTNRRVLKGVSKDCVYRNVHSLLWGLRKIGKDPNQGNAGHFILIKLRWETKWNS